MFIELDTPYGIITLNLHRIAFMNPNKREDSKCEISFSNAEEDFIAVNKSYGEMCEILKKAGKYI